jgi:three-Cys-motif partner protein
MENATLYGEDDGLTMNEDVGSWTPDKYALVRLYCQLFSTGMKKKWEQRTYIDLYAGAGLSRVKGTGKILLGSPLIALSVDAPFDKYIFCEEDTAKLRDLEIRVRRDFPLANAVYISGDCNKVATNIIAEIPRSSPSCRSLGLCFVDPYDLSIKFRTLANLASARRLDFLCLLALHMDAGRNYARYEKEDSQKVDQFLKAGEWRVDWENAKLSGEKFPRFLAVRFARDLETIGHLPTPLHMMKEMRTTDRNVPLYHLALFSKHKTAFKFWTSVLEDADPNRTLFPLR